jgi:hypothetical protein
MTQKSVVIFLLTIIFVSCETKRTYELSGISDPLLDEWFANFKAADSAFSAEKFVPIFHPDAAAEQEWYAAENQTYSSETEPANTIDWNIYSPDRRFYLDLDFYSAVEGLKAGDIWYGGDIDTKTVLVDVRNNKAIDIIETNCCDGADDAFWVNDSVFVLLCREYDFRNEEWRPYISIWNKEKVTARYPYDGKINNFHDDKFSPFLKRLQRLGIKIPVLGHMEYNGFGETEAPY